MLSVWLVVHFFVAVGQQRLMCLEGKQQTLQWPDRIMQREVSLHNESFSEGFIYSLFPFHGCSKTMPTFYNLFRPMSTFYNLFRRMPYLSRITLTSLRFWSRSSSLSLALLPIILFLSVSYCRWVLSMLMLRFRATFTRAVISFIAMGEENLCLFGF